MKDRIKQHFEEAYNALTDFLNNPKNFEAIEQAGNAMVGSLADGGKIISCGNGGSMCDAMHFAEELTGRYRDNRPPIAAISISDPSHLSCVGNDYGYEHGFARFVEAVGQPGDILLGISTSGNSQNVILAAKAAKQKNMVVVALTGKDGGELASIADIEIRAPKSKFADRAQEIHIKIIHALIDFIERRLYEK